MVVEGVRYQVEKLAQGGCVSWIGLVCPVVAPTLRGRKNNKCGVKEPGEGPSVGIADTNELPGATGAGCDRHAVTDTHRKDPE